MVRTLGYTGSPKAAPRTRTSGASPANQDGHSPVTSQRVQTLKNKADSR
jgi:hypothetical protein